MRSFADRSPRARWPRLLVVVGPTVVLVACSHSGLNALVLREVVVDWPPGLEAILAVTATPFGDEITLAITVVDAGGAFVLVLPKPDDGLLVAVTNVYKTVPECQTDLSDPAVRLLFVAEFAIIDDAGQPLGRLAPSRSEQGQVSSLSFVYADSEGSVLQTCSYPDASFDIALDLQAGWNPLLTETSLGTLPTHYTITTTAVPTDLDWHYQEYSDLSKAHARWYRHAFANLRRATKADRRGVR